MTDPRVLVVAPRFPLPLQSGDQLRIYHTLTALAESCDVTLVALDHDGESDAHVRELESLGVDVRPVSGALSKRETLLRYGLTTRPYRTIRFVTDEFRRTVRDVLDGGSFDLLWIHFLTTLPVLPADVSVRVVLDQHNADVRYWESFSDGRLDERLFARANRLKLRRLRSRWAARIDAILAVSEADTRVTRRWADCPVWTVPNGVDLDRFTPSRSAGSADPRVVFVGSLDVHMNVEAVQWFVEQAWPTVRERHPDATFHVVGRNPSPTVCRLGHRDGVTVVGSVPAVVPHYDDAAAAIAPFRLGGGTKLKVLEALAMERPLIATPTGVTGIDLDDGTHALIRERSDEFASAVADVLADPDLRTRLGANGRSFVEAGYAWSRIMDEALEKIRVHLLRET